MTLCPACLSGRRCNSMKSRFYCAWVSVNQQRSSVTFEFLTWRLLLLVSAPLRCQPCLQMQAFRLERPGPSRRGPSTLWAVTLWERLLCALQGVYPHPWPPPTGTDPLALPH